MNTKTLSSKLLAGLVIAAVSGCVNPGEIDNTDISRYRDRIIRSAERDVYEENRNIIHAASDPAMADLLFESIVPRIGVVTTTIAYSDKGSAAEALQLSRGRDETDDDSAGDRLMEVEVSITVQTVRTKYSRDPKTGKVVSESEQIKAEPSKDTKQEYVPNIMGDGDPRWVEVTTTIESTHTTYDPERYDPKAKDSKDGIPEEARLERRVVTRIEKRKIIMAAEDAAIVPDDETVESNDRVGRETWTESVYRDKTRMAHMSLKDAVMRTLDNNMEIRVVGYEAEISRQEMVRAAAVFDYVVFGGLNYSKDDLVFNSFGTSTSQTKHQTATAGMRSHTVTGADVEVAYELDREWNDSAARQWGTDYNGIISLRLTQPLLRNAWPSVNLASLRIARINQKITDEAFRQRAEEVVAETVTAYWTLAQARRDLEIQELLLAKTIETLKEVIEREALDATKVQIKQAEAAVESRRAALYRDRKLIMDVQDAIGRLMADRQINVMGDYELVPDTKPNRRSVTIDVPTKVHDALMFNPILSQARRTIEAADISVHVAKNATLPLVNLSASTNVRGLDNSYETVWSQERNAEYLSWALGLTVEYPIGNRDAKAGLQAARYSRLRAISEMRNLALRVRQDVRERSRQISTSFQEMKAQRVAVEAAREQLLAIEASGDLRERTPEFLQLKLQSQEVLASAARAELQALITYNRAMIGLAQATGTVLQQFGVETIHSGDVDEDN